MFVFVVHYGLIVQKKQLNHVSKIKKLNLTHLQKRVYVR